MPAGKRAAADGGEGGAAAEAKRQRPSADPPRRFDGGSRRVDLLNPATPRSEGELRAEEAAAVAEAVPATDIAERAPHPMDALDAIRAQLTETTDPHLQAKLLLRFSEAAISPGALTDAAIDFLFAFLQENQKANAGSAGGESKGADQGKGGGDAGSSGAIVVGAIVRGLRSLLAVKAAVVEPMIQVDAMGEQLMQCLSVGEDFKLRQEMMRIVIDCLMLSRRFAQVARLLATCVRDHDPGMQAICLRGYLRLHDADHGVVITSDDSGSGNSAAGVRKMGEHFDRLATFLLHGRDEEVRVLAARAIAALVAETPVQRLEIRSSFFPATAASSSRRRLVLQEMAFYVLCMAANDATTTVRVECAVSLRGFISIRSCVDREIIEHAVQKMPVEDMSAGESTDDDEMRTIRMMSSGALLSLLEDPSMRVVEEASRTVARMQRASLSRGRARSPHELWSERALWRVVVAHFDALARLNGSSEAMSLHQVLVTSLMQLVACLHEQFPDRDIVLSTEQMNSLLLLPPSPLGGLTKWLITVLSVLASCNLTSVTAVRRTLDTVLEAAEQLDDLAALLSTKHQGVKLPNELTDILSTIGEKCAPVMRTQRSLSERLEATVVSESYKQSICRVLLMGRAYVRPPAPAPTHPAPAGVSGSAFERFVGTKKSLKPPTTVADGNAEGAAALLSRPLNYSDNGVTASYLKAIQRLRSHFGAEDALPSCYLVADSLLRLKQCLRSLSTISPTTPRLPGDHSQLPLEAAQHCRVLTDLSRSALIKQSALNAPCRIELLQLALLARIGAVLNAASSQTQDRRMAAVGCLSRDASQIQRLLSGTQPAFSTPSLSPPPAGAWFNFDVLRNPSSVEEITREFVRVAISAWPSSWLSLAADAQKTGAMSALMAEASARIFFDRGRCEPPKEPLEITANWPFMHRVRAVVECVRDISQVFVKCVLPNGETQLHKVPLSALASQQSPWYFTLDHSISLTISPFSDPTTFAVAICLRHGRIPGAGTEDDDGPAYTEISPRVSIPIFHRTTSALRPPPPKTKA